MSYEFHITRAESWLEDSSPVTLAEIQTIIDPLPNGFSVDRSGFVSAATPEGRTLTAAVGDYLIYENPDIPDSRVHIYFDADCPPRFRIGAPEQLLPIIDLAEKLGAGVQGDELEFYRKENIPRLTQKQSKPMKKRFTEHLKALARIPKQTKL